MLVIGCFVPYFTWSLFKGPNINCENWTRNFSSFLSSGKEKIPFLRCNKRMCKMGFYIFLSESLWFSNEIDSFTYKHTLRKPFFKSWKFSWIFSLFEECQVFFLCYKKENSRAMEKLSSHFFTIVGKKIAVILKEK